MRAEQNGPHLADKFPNAFYEWKSFNIILIKRSLKFVFVGPIDKSPRGLVMTGSRTGTESLHMSPLGITRAQWVKKNTVRCSWHVNTSTSWTWLITLTLFTNCLVVSWRHNNVTLGTGTVWRMTTSFAVVQPPVADRVSSYCRLLSFLLSDVSLPVARPRQPRCHHVEDMNSRLTMSVSTVLSRVDGTLLPELSSDSSHAASDMLTTPRPSR